MKAIKQIIRSFTFWFILLDLILPYGFLYILSHGNPIMNVWIEYDATKHLNDRGYKKEDILEQHVVIPKMVINRGFYHAHYMVIFKEEPNSSYYYGKKKYTGEIVQFCEKEKVEAGTIRYISDKTKHSEKACVSIFANRE